MPRTRSLMMSVALGSTLALAACGGDSDDATGAPAPAPAPSAATQEPEATDPTAEPSQTTPDRQLPARGKANLIAQDLETPWDIDFLPGGDALVTERDARKIVRIPAGGGPTEDVMTVPGVKPSGEGGLLGLAVSPKFATDNRIYVYFTAERDNRVARIDLETERLTPILTGLRKGEIHNGGALSFGPDGKLYVGVGEVGEPGLAQRRSSRNGKILRIETSGKPAKGNPCKGSPVWSLGHRNVQGLAWDASKRLWATEFGQNEVDEVNVIKRGRNYGWPTVEGRGGTGGGRFVNPAITWSPTSDSSPSGAAIVGTELYVGALAGQKLWRASLDGSAAAKPVAMFEGELGRIRAVATSPSGTIWFATSNTDGRGAPGNIDDRILELGVE